MKMKYKPEKLVNYALSEGADEAEIFTRITKTLEAKTEGEKMKNDSKWIVETSIRIAVGKSISVACLTTDNEKIIKEMIKKTIKLARNNPPDPYWNGLPNPKSPLEKIDNWSEKLETIDQKQLTNRVRNDLKHIKSIDDRVKPVSIRYNISSTAFTIVNSNKIYAVDRFNGFGYYVEVKAEDKGRESNTFGYRRSKTSAIPSNEIIERTVKRAVELLEGEKMGKIYRGPILMDPVASSTTLYFSLARVITGTAVQEGYSPLAKKIGEKISDKRLSIYDDGLLKDGWNTRKFDDEGVPRQKTQIIVDGKLVGFIHNTYTARRMDMESTGNAERRESNIGVEISNLTVKPGTKDLDKLMSSYDELIMIKNMPMGAHTINFMTGSVNMVATEVYYVKKGSIEKILKPLTITGNIYEALKDIEVGREIEDTPFNIYTPPIIFTGFTLA